MKKILFIGAVLVSAMIGTTGCGIKSKDAYQKSKLSGFVADQTQLMIEENNVKMNKGDGGIGKVVEETKDVGDDIAEGLKKAAEKIKSGAKELADDLGLRHKPSCLKLHVLFVQLHPRLFL